MYTYIHLSTVGIWLFFALSIQPVCGRMYSFLSTFQRLKLLQGPKKYIIYIYIFTQFRKHQNQTRKFTTSSEILDLIMTAPHNFEFGKEDCFV